jgi:integrase
LTHFYTLANEAITKADVLGIEPTIEYLRGILTPDKKVVIAEPITKGFFDLWQDFITIETKNPKKGLSAIKNYKVVRNNLIKYSAKIGLTLDLATISPNDTDKLITAMISDNMASSTINHQLKNLIVFINWAIKNEYTVSAKAKQIKKPKAVRSDIHHLEKEELEVLENAVLTDSLARHRDLFLFMCYTGIRYSDLANLQPENYKADKITFTTIKTKDYLSIPLTNKAKQLVAKYGGAMPSPITNQKMNEALKEIGEKAGLIDMVQIVDFKGGKRNQDTKPKYKLLTCHIARRTFVMQCRNHGGLGFEVIQKFTGHKDIKTLMQYVNVTSEAASKEFLEAMND